MDVFQVVAKIWPTGATLDLGTDSSVYTVTYSPTRIAAQFALSGDGTQNYQFLFWNTGRHTTSKRMVHWTINNAGWGTWTATKWYGIPPPPGPGGPSRVRADAFSMRDNAPMAATPIDPSSTYAAGAWPSGGDDHVISTTAGAATVVAKDPFPGPLAGTTYDFAGWLQLMWGGDPTGVFEENDSGTTSISPDSTGYYDHLPAAPFPVAMNTSADLVATYGTYHSGGDRPNWDWLRALLEDVGYRGPDLPYNVDPAPPDLIRLAILERLVARARPAAGGGGDFQRLMEIAPTMDREALKRAIQSIKTSLDLGNAALTTIEARLKGLGK
jgi:hypothetical protein